MIRLSRQRWGAYSGTASIGRSLRSVASRRSYSEFSHIYLLLRTNRIDVGSVESADRALHWLLPCRVPYPEERTPATLPSARSPALPAARKSIGLGAHGRSLASRTLADHRSRSAPSRAH